MEAFKPKKSLFIHCCQNCEFGRKLADSRTTALNYICMKDTEKPKYSVSVRHLPGLHNCDVDIDDTGNQISWFDELKEEE